MLLRHATKISELIQRQSPPHASRTSHRIGRIGESSTSGSDTILQSRFGIWIWCVSCMVCKTRQWRKYSDILLMYLFHLATYSLQQYFLSTSTFSDVLTSTYFKLTSTMDAAAHLASPFAVLFQPDINQTSPLTAPDPSTT
jgi:hypothetical protein